MVFQRGSNRIVGPRTKGEGDRVEWDMSLRFLAWAAHFIQHRAHVLNKC